MFTVEVLPRSIEPGVIPLLQTLGVEDNHQCSVLLAREGQEENSSNTWPRDSCGKRSHECVGIAFGYLIELLTLQ